jgi:hypothetical protein
MMPAARILIAIVGLDWGLDWGLDRLRSPRSVHISEH